MLLLEFFGGHSIVLEVVLKDPDKPSIDVEERALVTNEEVVLDEVVREDQLEELELAVELEE